MELSIRVKRLSDNAILPKKNSVGYDLYASADCVIPALGKNSITTDLSIIIPEGYHGRIVPKFIMTWNHTSVNDILAPNYRGSIFIVMFNHSASDILISTHDKIAQLIIEKTVTSSILEVHE